MLHVTSQTRDVIVAELTYAETYRYRLWLAAVEDSATLGMGFRAYYAHVLASLDLWKKAGTDFLNGRGGPLSPDILKVDDLWGFFGKKEDNPKGPQRRIQDGKLAVLDAYFKKKYPELASSFSKKVITLELSSILRSFYSATDDGNFFSADSEDLLQSICGVYIKPPLIDLRYIRAKLKDGGSVKLTINVIMLSQDAASNNCIVHILYVPLRSEYISEKSMELGKAGELGDVLAHHSPPETVVLSGLGLIAGKRISGDRISVSSFLRDRVTYEPYLTNIDVVRHEYDYPDSKYITKYLFEGYNYGNSNNFIYCGNKTNDLEQLLDISGCSEKFLDYIFDKYHLLGAEV